MTEQLSTKTLGEALPLEIARVRDELIPAYQSIGPAGTFGLLMLRQALDRASKSMIEGDLPAMIAAYEELRQCQ